MAEEILMGIANKIKEIIPEAEITEAGEKVLITAEHEIGIKGISITIECSTRSIKVKGSREYKYPITDKAVEEFQEEMLSKYPGYGIYVSGQILSYSKVFTYQDELYAINEIKNNIDIIEDAVLTFENDCVNFMEKEVDNKNSSEEYNPEDNINIVNVDNSFHAVSTTEQDNSNYEEQHNNYAKKVFYDLAKRLDADVNGNEMSAVYADDTTIRCVLFPLDAEILVSVSVHATRDIGAMYASYITSNYPELMSSFDEESGLFSVRTYSSPDEYEPEGTQDLLELCITASKACVNEYKQTLEKKDSADFASDVQQILAEQTETVWEREKAVAAREEEMANKEAEERREIIQQGVLLYGVTYSMGDNGEPPRNSPSIENPKYLDCSSFTGQCYWRAGVLGKEAVDWTTGSFSSNFHQIQESELIPGDIGQLNWNPGGSGPTEHIGIYIGTVNGTKYWIHCTGHSPEAPGEKHPAGKGIVVNDGNGSFHYYGRCPSL